MNDKNFSNYKMEKGIPMPSWLNIVDVVMTGGGTALKPGRGWSGRLLGCPTLIPWSEPALVWGPDKWPLAPRPNTWPLWSEADSLPDPLPASFRLFTVFGSVAPEIPFSWFIWTPWWEEPESKNELKIEMK